MRTELLVTVYMYTLLGMRKVVSNKDFTLCFNFDIHIYIKYSAPIDGGTEISLHKVITLKLYQNYMILDMFEVYTLDHFSCGMMFQWQRGLL